MDIAIIVVAVLGIIVTIVVDGYVEATRFIQKYKQIRRINYGNC